MEPLAAFRAQDDVEPGREVRIIDIRRLIGYIGLAVFVVAGTISGFLWGLKFGFGALAITSLITAYLLGAE